MTCLLKRKNKLQKLPRLMTQYYLFLKLLPKHNVCICWCTMNMKCLPQDCTWKAWSPGVHIILRDGWNFRRWEPVIRNQLPRTCLQEAHHGPSCVHLCLLPTMNWTVFSTTSPLPWCSATSASHRHSNRASHHRLRLLKLWAKPFLPLSHFSLVFVTALRRLTYQPCPTMSLFWLNLLMVFI